MITHIDKYQLKMTASEMLCFIRHFCIILGHYVSDTDKTWKLIKQLRNVVQMAMSTHVDIKFYNLE